MGSTKATYPRRDLGAVDDDRHVNVRRGAHLGGLQRVPQHGVAAAVLEGFDEPAAQVLAEHGVRGEARAEEAELREGGGVRGNRGRRKVRPPESLIKKSATIGSQTHVGQRIIKECPCARVHLNEVVPARAALPLGVQQLDDGQRVEDVDVVVGDWGWERSTWSAEAGAATRAVRYL